MKSIIILEKFCLVFFCLLTVNTFSQNKTYNNPVIPGFNPDPSVCRVGDDYYLVTSTFEYFPGVPIYHSKDLVNWQIIGHVLHRPEQLDLDNVVSTAGIYAPTLRYHNGVFYMITTLVTNREDKKPKGNFIVTATNPEGPWSMPYWIEDAPGIDPSLFFDDDGKAYYCGNFTPKDEELLHTSHRNIWIQEIDLKTFKLKGKREILDSKPYFIERTIGSPYAFEAPHLYKKEGFYYLVLAHGGTGMWHAVSIWKSKSPLGSWEENPNNPILTHRGDETSGINATGHADIFQTKEGDWWSVFLAVRSNDKKNNVMGRETFLAPVDWYGEWPVYNPEGETGKTAFIHKAPKMFMGKQRSFNYTDNFEDKNLNLSWSMIRTPRTVWWKIKSGKLELKLRPDEIENYEQPSFLGIRVPAMKIEAITSLIFKPKKENECAGLAFERGHDEEYTLVKELHNGKIVVSAYYDGNTLLGRLELEANKIIELKIHLDHFTISFYVKEPQASWKQIAKADASKLGFPPAGRFTGSMVGPYASSRGEVSDNYASYNNFQLKTYTGK
ncbi:alpha-N-arabinofuranosidase [Lutibacter agarilyticus]|uniref:Alpha-N-arabinofuranosidase n=1 Tax=Lutibacter agarilyticus TaxID=1109740 RepID=A0A238Y634_9FLAO|nr:glycoside hydrolase family 43 protein [Lutibacter agarilyticus]SNR65799.1 alpha-N-arabinofuranosidase [Lutibacter agarilyticus]